MSVYGFMFLYLAHYCEHKTIYIGQLTDKKVNMASTGSKRSAKFRARRRLSIFLNNGECRIVTLEGIYGA